MTDLHTENARLRAALEACVNMLDDLVAESGRGIEYGEEDAFRMGEWFDDHELRDIDTARAALATPAPDAVQEAARVPEIAALIEAAKDLYETAIATKARVTGGICGQTIECSMRSTMHSVSLFHLDVLNAALRAISGDRT